MSRWLRALHGYLFTPAIDRFTLWFALIGMYAIGVFLGNLVKCG